MTTTYLADMVTAIRLDLHDTDAAAYRWTDTAIQRHIARALAEYGHANPITTTLDIAAVAGNRTYDLAGDTPAALADLNNRPDSIFAVEWPKDVDAQPPNLVPFRTWNNTLWLLVADAPASGDTIRVWYHKAHTLSDSTKTYPAEHDYIIQSGAAAYAALELQINASDRINTSGWAVKDYASWGTIQLQTFNAAIQHLAQLNAQAIDTRATWDSSRI